MRWCDQASINLVGAREAAAGMAEAEEEGVEK